jgi:hypothetical protein
MHRLAFSVALGVLFTAVCGTAVRAQDATVVPVPAGTPVTVSPANTFTTRAPVASPALEPWAFAPGEGNYDRTPPPQPGFVHRMVHRLPCWCWADVNSAGCSSLKAECTFVFGSCRQFYGQPCYKGPAPVPGLPNGGSYGNTGCACP